MKAFEPINKGFNYAFKANQLSIGIVIPIENYTTSAVPTMASHVERAKLADELGFKALWVRDVPLQVPSFGDAGQTYDPFTYLGFLAAHTQHIALCTGSIALPLHHPIHVAKSAATIDQLSDGRLILGVASGDRPAEYPAMGVDFEERGDIFRDAFTYIRKAQEDFPSLSSRYFGHLNGQSDILPKAKMHKIPMLVTGHSRQSTQWIAENADGWLYYPRNFYMQHHNISEWRGFIPKSQAFDKPFMQPLYVDLQDDDNFMPRPIHLGFKTGAKYLVNYLQQLKAMGVNHVAINLRFNTSKIESTLANLAKKVLPYFHLD